MADSAWRFRPQLGLEIVRRVVASLGVAAERAGRLAEALASFRDDPGCFEASVRGGPDGRLRAGRMMIERASGAVLEEIARAVDVALPRATQDWIDLAAREQVPVIAGWDLRGGAIPRCVKLYINASDAADAVKARIYRTLCPALPKPEASPAVLGTNILADGSVESKVYVQTADTLALASRASGWAAKIATTAIDENAAAGAVMSFEVTGTRLTPRAFFVALREPPAGKTWRCVEALPGYDGDTVASLMPFDPAAPRSIGIGLGSGDWTIYCKPRASSRAPETLEPAAVFRAGGVEVGIFVEPTATAARAFRRTRRHAVSVRVRAGQPSARMLESLVDWFAARVQVAERTSRFSAEQLTDPPAPWLAVSTAGLGSLIDEVNRS